MVCAAALSIVSIAAPTVASPASDVIDDVKDAIKDLEAIHDALESNRGDSAAEVGAAYREMRHIGAGLILRSVDPNRPGDLERAIHALRTLDPVTYGNLPMPAGAAPSETIPRGAGSAEGAPCESNRARAAATVIEQRLKEREHASGFGQEEKYKVDHIRHALSSVGDDDDPCSSLRYAAGEIESRLREIEQLGHWNDEVKWKVDHVRRQLIVVRGVP